MKPFDLTSQTPPSSAEHDEQPAGRRQREERRLGVLDPDRLAHGLKTARPGRRERAATTTAATAAAVAASTEPVTSAAAVARRALLERAPDDLPAALRSSGVTLSSDRGRGGAAS